MEKKIKLLRTLLCLLVVCVTFFAVSCGGPGGDDDGTTTNAPVSGEAPSGESTGGDPGQDTGDPSDTEEEDTDLVKDNSDPKYDDQELHTFVPPVSSDPE